jgi:hypothetical protein
VIFRGADRPVNPWMDHRGQLRRGFEVAVGMAWQEATSRGGRSTCHSAVDASKIVT